MYASNAETNWFRGGILHKKAHGGKMRNGKKRGRGWGGVRTAISQERAGGWSPGTASSPIGRRHPLAPAAPGGPVSTLPERRADARLLGGGESELGVWGVDVRCAKGSTGGDPWGVDVR